jgi:hypothetical protein
MKISARLLASIIPFTIDDGTLTLSFGEGGADARSDGNPRQAGRRRVVQGRECPRADVGVSGAHRRAT